MTIKRLQAYRTYWEDFPPVHVSMAGFVGHKPKNRKSDKLKGLIDLFESGALGGG